MVVGKGDNASDNPIQERGVPFPVTEPVGSSFVGRIH